VTDRVGDLAVEIQEWIEDRADSASDVEVCSATLATGAGAMTDYCWHIFQGGVQCVKCGLMKTDLEKRIDDRAGIVGYWSADCIEAVDNRMPFEVHQSGDVVQGGVVLGSLTSDEMLESIVRMVFMDAKLSPQWSYAGEPSRRDGWSLCVVPVGRGGWSIEEIGGTRFSGQLTDGEVCGWLASMIFAGVPLYGGLKSYEQHAATWGPRVDVRGLIHHLV